MNKDETIALYEKGVDAWNAWAEGIMLAQAEYERKPQPNTLETSISQQLSTSDAAANFEEHKFSDHANFAGFVFPGVAQFQGARFHVNANFTDATFRKDAQFNSSTFTGDLCLKRTKFLGKSNFQFAVVHGEPDFTDAEFKQTLNLASSTFNHHLELSTCVLGLENCFQQSIFQNGLSLISKNLTAQNFKDSRLYKSKFSGSLLFGTDFQGAVLTDCDLLGVSTDTKTNFGESTVVGCKITRVALDCMDDFGGLSRGAMMRMDIYDDVATLRKSYSGFSRWLHIFAMLAFVFPYIWFFLARWSEATFSATGSSETIPLWDAFARFLYNGGIGWEYGYNLHWTFLVFVFAFLYNLLRGTLLLKTNSLEFHQEVTGFPAIFNLSDRIAPWTWMPSWNNLLWASKYGMWLLFLPLSSMRDIS